MERKQSETGKSIFRNVLYGFSTWFLPLGLSFVATPIIVKSLGDRDYGIYALVLGFVGYSFNFSFGRALTKYIAEYRAVGENEKIPELISAAFFINIIVGLLGVSIVCFLANWLVLYVLKIDLADRDKSVIALYIASSIIFFSMLNQIFTSIIQGIQRFDVYSKIFNVNNLLLLSGNLLLAIFGYKLISLFLWNLIVVCFMCAIFAFAAKKLVPEFNLRTKFRFDTLKLILLYSSGVIGYQILSNFLLLFERGWITRQLGTENLTYYVVPMTLSFYIHGFVSSLIIVIFPLASELKNDKEKLLRLYTKATKIVCLFVVFLGTTLATESKVLLTLWISADFAEKTWVLLVIHTITFSIVAMQTVSWQMTEGSGFPNYNFFVFVICLVICLFLMVGLTPIFGSVGVAIGRMIGMAAIFLSVFYVEKWFFKSVQTEFWLKLIGILTAAAFFSVMTEKLVIENFAIGWISMFISIASGAIVYTLILWILGFVTDEERILFRKIISR